MSQYVQNFWTCSRELLAIVFVVGFIANTANQLVCAL